MEKSALKIENSYYNLFISKLVASNKKKGFVMIFGTDNRFEVLKSVNFH